MNPQNNPQPNSTDALLEAVLEQSNQSNPVPLMENMLEQNHEQTEILSKIANKTQAPSIADLLTSAIVEKVFGSIQGPKGEQGIQGEKGDTYELTENDKKEIADKIALDLPLGLDLFNDEEVSFLIDSVANKIPKPENGKDAVVDYSLIKDDIQAIVSLIKPIKGDKGDKGEAGKDGNIITATEIVEKLEGLKKGERLSYDKLDDLPNLEALVMKTRNDTGFLRDLSDVSLSNLPTANDVLTWDGTRWTASASSGSSSTGGGPQYSIAAGTDVVSGNVYYGTVGSETITLTEAGISQAVGATTYNFLKIKINTNSLNSTTTISLRVNGVDAGPSVSIGASATGIFTSTASVTTVANDLVSYRITTTGSSSGTMEIQSLLIGGTPITIDGVVSIVAGTGITVNSTDPQNPIVSASGGSSWGLTGNTGTTAGTNFIGTNDSQDFVIKTNTAERIRVQDTGEVTIGTDSVLNGATLTINNISTSGGSGMNFNGTGGSAPATIEFSNTGVYKAFIGVPTVATGVINDSGANDFVFRTENNPIRFSTNGGSSTKVIITGDDGYLGLGQLAPTSQLGIQPNSASIVGEIIKGFASQSADLTEWQNNAGTVLAKVTSTGAGTFANLTDSAMTSGSVLFAGTAGLISQDNSNLFWDDTNNRLGIGTASPSAALEVRAGSASTVGSIIKGAASQTADLFQAQNSSGTKLTYITSAGDLDMASGQFIRYNGQKLAYGQTALSNFFFGKAGNPTLASMTGVDNNAFGDGALFSLTSGQENNAMGINALLSVTSGTHNIGIGRDGGYGITTGTYNVAIGYRTLRATTTASNNTVVGRQSGEDITTGAANAFYGYFAGADTTTGSNNLAMGTTALQANTTGSQNMALGYQALASIVGSNNVAVGSVAWGVASTGDNNTAIGYNAGINATSGSKNIIIGHNINIPSASGSNQLNIGNIIFGTGVSGTGTTIAGNIGIGNSAPNSSLQVTGSLSLSYVEKTGAYTITASDYTINCTSGTFTVTLPTAVGITGRIYVIKNSGIGVVTLGGNGSETIDGNATETITSNASRTVQSTGANWIIV